MLHLIGVIMAIAAAIAFCAGQRAAQIFVAVMLGLGAFVVVGAVALFIWSQT